MSTHTAFCLGGRQCFVQCRVLRAEVTRAVRLETCILFEHMLLGYPVNTSRGCDDAPDMLVCHCSLQCFSYSAVAPALDMTLKNI